MAGARGEGRAAHHGRRRRRPPDSPGAGGFAGFGAHGRATTPDPERRVRQRVSRDLRAATRAADQVSTSAAVLRTRYQHSLQELAKSVAREQPAQASEAEDMQRLVARIDAALGGLGELTAPAVRASLHVTQGEILRDTGDLDGARRAMARAEAHAPDGHVEVAQRIQGLRDSL